MYILKILIKLYSYTLFGSFLGAAERNGYGDLSDELITDEVVAKLAQLVANAKPIDEGNGEQETLFYTRDNPKDENYSGQEENLDNEFNEYGKEESADFRAQKDEKTKIDIDDIVEKVKAKIEEDLRVKYGLKVPQSHDKTKQKNVVDRTNVEVSNKKKQKRTYDDVLQKVPPQKQKNDNFQYDRNVNPYLKGHVQYTAEKLSEGVPDFMKNPNRNVQKKLKVHKNNNNPNMQYDKIQMVKHGDSYDDYVTPAKERDLYSSDEKGKSNNSQGKTKNRQETESKSKYRQDFTNDIERTTSIYYDEESTRQTEELKARTQNLGGDYNVRDLPKRIGGSERPKRQFYRLSSPNYYGLLSTVAERYNFDEPLPERDRERENFRPIGNPPAKINGKVKLTRNKQGYFE